jgi:hypothetical protein
MTFMDAEHTMAQPAITTDKQLKVENHLHKLAPWMAGSGIAMGQALLATACSLPTVGKCVGCGSCVVGVATLCSWALKRRKADQTLREQGLEPFEIRTQREQNDNLLP